MTPSGRPRWVKHYLSATSCRTAAANHQWLASLGGPVPHLRVIGDEHLEFDYVAGRHAQPGDLPHLADLLGRLHLRGYTADLCHARLDLPYTTRTGLTIPDFLTIRQRAVADLLTRGAVPSAPFTAAQAERELERAAHGPACFYKDSNPRNFLITAADGKAGGVLVDFDVLTLAPVGYDLAKLIVTLTMTHGPLPAATIRQALDTYNRALSDASTGLRPVPWSALMIWADIHHILTGRYLGRGGYRYEWNGELR